MANECIVCSQIISARLLQKNPKRKFCSRACYRKFSFENRKSLEEKFWPHVQKTEACWNWTGATQRYGYGCLNYNGTKTASRVSYEIHIGKIPKGLYVCHRCDNTACVNPEHLFIGTQKDNMQDMWKKGRGFAPSHTHCKAGHLFTKETTTNFKGSKNKKAYRTCRLCKNRRLREWRASLKHPKKLKSGDAIQ